MTAAIAGSQGPMIGASLSSLMLRIVGLISTFGLGVVLARALGPAEYGTYGLVTSVAALAMTIALLGTPQLAVRELSVRSARGDWASVKGLITRFGLSSGIAAIALGLVAVSLGFAFTPDGDPRPHLIILGALLTLMMTLTALVAAELRGLGAMIKGQVLEIAVRPAAVFLIALALVAAGARLEAVGALWIQIFVATGAAAISMVWIRRALPVEARSIPATENFAWMGAAIPLWLVDIFRQFDGTYGIVLMGWFASAADLGVYRVALSCMVVVGMPISILHIVQAPAVSRLYKFGQHDELQRMLSATSAAMVAIVTPITLAAWFIGRPALSFVFGAAYADSWLPLFLLCIAQLAFGFFGMGPILLAMCDAERQLIKIYVASVGLGALAAVPLVQMFGATGAAVAMIISTGSIGLLSWRHGKSRLGVDSSFLPLVRR